MKDLAFYVRKAQKGNPEAFVKIMQEYETVLFNLARRFLREEEDIKDVLQETTISAYENIRKLKQPEYFHTWLTRILINKCKRFLNKEVFFEELTEQTPRLSSEHPEEQVEISELLSNLPPHYRVPLTLYYYGGYSIKEISQLLEEPVGTIKARLSRGKRKLRNNCSDEGGLYHHG